MKFDLPDSIKFILNTIISNGHKAYIVGGCVRDLLCNKKPHDYDITTSARPEEVKSMFKKTVDTGIKHGTVTVILDKFQFEVTTFRCEGIYTDSRHPDKVDFITDVTKDLARRDFTVNAMCYNDEEGLIDCFGGIDDVKKHILKAVGDPKTRFEEDALRILRLFRFSATLQFDIEKDTFAAALKCADLLENISPERIFAELEKASDGENIRSLSPLIQSGALKKYLIANTNQGKMSKLEHKHSLRLFALIKLTSSNLPETLDRLKCSNFFKEYCKKINRLCDNTVPATKTDIKKAMNFAGKEVFNDALYYYRDVLGINTDVYNSLYYEIEQFNEPYLISQLDISGNDITALGITGKEVRKTLEFLLQKVIEDPKLNNRKKLIEFVCN